LDFEHASGGESNTFEHVTTLGQGGEGNVRAVLAYACIRLAHLSHDAFGDSRAATRLYRLAKKIDTVPSAVASHGIGNSIEASLDFEEDSEGDLKAWRERMGDVVEAYKEAVGFGGYNEGEVLFHLAVALEVSGLICRKIINSFVRLSQFIFVLNPLSKTTAALYTQQTRHTQQ
jgi:hypothetical protein